MALQALGKWVFIDPIRRSEQFADELKDRAGLEFQAKAEGAPFMGIIKQIGTEVPDDFPYSVGTKVIFDEPSPNGINWKGEKFIPVDYSKILAEVSE